ncbi:MAG: Gfo/Idh/MocA family oxidoreductase [Paracoccaceae bacterium]
MQAVLPKRAVLIGAGMVAGTHINACAAAAKTVRLVGIVAQNAANAKTLATEVSHKFTTPLKAYDTVGAVAADPDVEFAIIATPPNARANVIAPLVAAGKHILLEKPMGRNGDEARAVVALCAKAGVTLGVVLQHRMRAASQKAAAFVASGRLGALGLVEIAVPWWREQAYYEAPGRGTYARDGGGVLISQAIHTLDLALSLAGPVAGPVCSVRAMATTTRFHVMEAEDFVVAGLRFANGAAGSLFASTASYPGGAESIILHFERASLRLQSGELHISWRDGRTEQFGANATTGGGADPMAFTHDWHQAIIEDFAQALALGRAPAITGQDALAAHDLIDAISRAAATGAEQELAA